MESCEKSVSEGIQKEDVTLEPIGQPIVEENDDVAENAAERQVSKYAKMTKEELVVSLSGLLDQQDVDIKDDVTAIKHHFYNIRKAELEEEKKSFVERGNELAAFAPMPDAQEEQLKVLLQKYKDIRAAQQEALEAQLQENLSKKQAIIAELESIVADPDNINKQYQKFQQLQSDFKEVGNVPPTDDKQLWKAYQLVTENFYDLWKMNKELRDYDFKKNLEAKEALCEEAEALAAEKDVISAFNKLQRLHEKWREVGPVVKDLRESIWGRFKDASTVVNKRHQAFFEEKKAKEKENEEAKVAICQEAESIELPTLTSFQQWDEATKQIIALQERWKTLGYAAKKVNNELFARFRKSCDEFFAQKAVFFKNRKDEFAVNLAKKHELCEKAESLKDSTDWKTTADALIELQKEWKKIGPVPKKSGDAVWKKFIEACDYFFENKNKNVRNVHQEERANLEKKRVLVEKLKNIDEAMPKADIRNLLKDMSAEFKGIGHVPFKERDKIYNEYKTALNAAYDKFDLDGKKMRMNNFVSNVSEISNDKNKLFKERERLVRLYEQKKNEVKTFENNLGFFNVTSKTGGAVLKEMENRIARAKKDLETLEEQIGLIDEKL